MVSWFISRGGAVADDEGDFGASRWIWFLNSVEILCMAVCERMCGVGIGVVVVVVCQTVVSGIRNPNEVPVIRLGWTPKAGGFELGIYEDKIYHIIDGRDNVLPGML
ncbi:hypothetical protein BDZ94DRAFT_1263388 [Collybia nuda]|uniref:Uncharacterized protein n=1 Tax=Collybia nuda TaxID=64659 RepID=A0A9P5Y5I3_9AGAR|nr:hypothetical protein BDZ94DRAFT_1263388 [Collybia nuda]